MTSHSAVSQCLVSPGVPSEHPSSFFPDTHSAASCIARSTASRAVPSLSASDVPALVTELLDHTDLYGALPALARSGSPHKAQQARPKRYPTGLIAYYRVSEKQ